jgi:hypothetical protein
LHCPCRKKYKLYQGEESEHCSGDDSYTRTYPPPQFARQMAELWGQDEVGYSSDDSTGSTGYFKRPHPEQKLLRSRVV